MFYGVRWEPLCEYEFLKISDVALAVQLIFGARVVVEMYTLVEAGTSTTFLLHLGLVNNGDVVGIE